ncbi:glycosyltransferase [Mycolicibacterium baixiangningiae]|uniref:glycosyltransferase n=1 Tax=Mycolicibacterium baixiangningiae TaxID=2761578 RepID=UPI001865BA12|nr:glycosyltransferase family 2 protein [Mycolicibacterium baixiangningiae]
MTQKMNPLTIAMVTYNSRSHIADCVKWFVDRPADVTLRIRDNGSTDETPQVLRKLAADGYVDDVIMSDNKGGFAVAANDVISRSGNDDILLLNPDARTDLEAIAMMRRAVSGDPVLGMVAPLVTGGEEISVMSAGRQPRLWPMFTHYSGLSRAFPGVRALRGRHLFLSHHSSEDQLVEWTSGCCLYIPRSTIERVGVLSERWFLYGEDIEYCQRVLDAGLNIKVLAAAHAYHEVGRSSSPPVEEIDEPSANSVQNLTNRGAQPAQGADGSPLDVSTMWGRNLYDYYLRQFQPTSVNRLAWRITFTLGNASRAFLRLARDRHDRRAKHLMKNALAVWR